MKLILLLYRCLPLITRALHMKQYKKKFSHEKNRFLVRDLNCAGFQTVDLFSFWYQAKVESKYSLLRFVSGDNP